MFETRLVEFTTTDNLQLPGVLFVPEKAATTVNQNQLNKRAKVNHRAKTNSSQDKKAAIFLHGNGSASVFYSQKRAKALAKQLAVCQISLLMFNNRGAHFIKTINQADDQVNQVQSADSNNPHDHDVTLGTAYELIKDCRYDIEGAVNFLQQLGYSEFYLIGHSSGANKICVFNHYQPQNSIKKYVLLSGGDDTGIYYKLIGSREKLFQYLQQAQEKIKQGKGQKLIPQYIVDRILSYQSFYDTANPDGDYNTFPFTEYWTQIELSTKPLFRYFKQLQKPSLVMYGENDSCLPQKDLPQKEIVKMSGFQAVEILQEQVQDKDNFKLQAMPAADHSFHGKEEQLGQIIAEWLSA